MTDQPVKARWYILTIPYQHQGKEKQLQAALRKYGSDPSVIFEVFAPYYEKVSLKNGKMVKTNHRLFLNYVFVKSDLNFLKKLKREELSLYSFLPRIKDSKEECYPFVSDNQMLMLKWVAESYSNTIPVYVPQLETVMKGDKVRITQGQFKGMEAMVAIQPGRGPRNIIVSINDWAYVPLVNVKEGEYEVIEYNCDKKHLYTRMYNDALADKLHLALQHYYQGTVTEEDKALAKKAICEYGSVELRRSMLSKDDNSAERKQVVAGSRLYALLLPAYTILLEKSTDGQATESEIRWEQLIGEMLGVISHLKDANQSLALLYVTLYGCTNNITYYETAHQLVDPWRADDNTRKIKNQLISRLDDYDRWLGH